MALLTIPQTNIELPHIELPRVDPVANTRTLAMSLAPHDTIDYWRHPAVPEVELSQACFNHFSFDKHVHLDFHLGAVVQGAQDFVNKGTRFRLTRFDLSTLNPDETHDGQSVTDAGYQVKVMSVPVPMMRQLADDMGLSSPYFAAPLAHSPLLHQQFVALHQQLISGHCSALAAESLLMQFLQAVLERHGAPKQRSDVSHGLSRYQLAYIKQRFHDEPSQNVQLATLAQEVNLNKFQFLRQFKLATGMAPHAYFKRVRLEYAKKSLLSGCKVTEVAQQLGFFDQSHLTKSFKQAFLLTPVQFQRQMA